VFSSSPATQLKLTGLTHAYLPLDVANDVEIPGSKLITGANMGGKSTLLKSTCLAVILAQIGCAVPCQRYEASVIQNIFTRLGAYDNLLEAKSTFFTEMEETATVFKALKSGAATLVVMDELGRGTSTYDGMAIASATYNYLKERALCLFTTHYDFGLEKDVWRMGCEVKNQQEVKFTYKLEPGQSKSYAFNVARMAGLPQPIIDRAVQVAA
jgi:DNA mismatch repair protein MSH6